MAAVCVHERLAIRGSDRRQLRTRHDRACVRAACPTSERVFSQQHAKLVTAQHPPLTIKHHRGSQAVGVGIIGDHKIGITPRRLRECKIQSAGLLRVRKCHGRKVRIRGRLLCDGQGRRKATGRGDACDKRAAHAVQRRINPAQLTARLRA
jgi:hypothetical protein